jgi:hypothetical protein
MEMAGYCRQAGLFGICSRAEMHCYSEFAIVEDVVLVHARPGIRLKYKNDLSNVTSPGLNTYRGSNICPRTLIYFIYR